MVAAMEAFRDPVETPIAEVCHRKAVGGAE